MKNRYWIAHGGNANGVSEYVRSVFSDSLYAADTLGVFEGALSVLSTSGEGQGTGMEADPSQSDWQDRLATWFDENFTATREQAMSFVSDIRSSLPDTHLILMILYCCPVSTVPSPYQAYLVLVMLYNVQNMHTLSLREFLCFDSGEYQNLWKLQKCSFITSFVRRDSRRSNNQGTVQVMWV